MTLNYGLIGCGMMGIEHVRNISLLDDARVVAVLDPVREQAQMAASIAGGASIVSGVNDLLKNDDLDALVIASPNHVHVSQLEEIASLRALPILCEKPLMTVEEDVSRVRRLQRDYKAPVWVAMEYRYMPPITAFIERAQDVTGGIKMLTIQEHRFPFLEKIGDWNRFNGQTGGTFVEKCCHFFDLMRLILQSEPIRISASASQFVNHLDENYDGRIPDVIDGGYVMVDFESGAKAMLELCMFADGSKWNEEIHALGPKGKIACRLPGPQRFWPEELGPSPEPELSLFPRSPKRPTTEIIELDHTLVAAGDHHGSTFFQHQKFSKMVRDGGTPDVSLEDGLRAVMIGLKAHEAAVRHEVIHLEPGLT